MNKHRIFTQSIEALLEGYNQKKVAFILGWIDIESGSTQAISNLKDEKIPAAIEAIRDTFETGKDQIIDGD